jgi:hypothetical protein
VEEEEEERLIKVKIKDGLWFISIAASITGITREGAWFTSITSR